MQTPPPRRSRRHRIAAIAAVAAILVVALGSFGAYVYASNSMYDMAATLNHGWCDSTFSSDKPSSFSAVDGKTRVDTSPYIMPSYENVSITSRQAGVTLSGWWIPAAGGSNTDSSSAISQAPAVVVVHGHDKCKHDPEVLLPAGMLWHGGFSVLMIDMRNHGDSTTTPEGCTWGALEYEDVLGAWDWLQKVQGIPASRIGLYGVSMGAATSTIAMGHELRVAAVWEDSGWADTDQFFRDVLREKGYLEILEPGGIAIGRLLHGLDLIALTPAAALARLDGRPYFIVQGDADASVPVAHAYALADAIRAHAGTIEPWIVHGAGHVRSSYVATAEYDRRLVDFFRNALKG